MQRHNKGKGLNDEGQIKLQKRKWNQSELQILQKKNKETQEHILQNCPEMAKIVGKCEYENIFRDDVKTLRELADFIIKVEEKLQKPELPSMSSSTRSEPPG